MKLFWVTIAISPALTGVVLVVIALLSDVLSGNFSGINLADVFISLVSSVFLAYGALFVLWQLLILLIIYSCLNSALLTFIKSKGFGSSLKQIYLINISVSAMVALVVYLVGFNSFGSIKHTESWFLFITVSVGVIVGIVATSIDKPYNQTLNRTP